MALIRRYWGIIVMIGLAIIGGAVWSARQHRTPPTVHWKHASPLRRAPQASAISWGTSAAATTKPLALPAGQLTQANWLWPITPISSLAYILHDGQARWLYQKTAYNLKSAPVDPINRVAAAPDGRTIVWTTLSGLDELSAHTPLHQIASAKDPAFTTQNQLVYLDKSGTPSTVHAVTPWGVFSEPAAVWASAKPFFHHGQALAIDQQGHISVQNFSTGQKKSVASVYPAQWPNFIGAYQLGSGQSAFVLSNTTRLPVYLIILVHHNHPIAWYRWSSGLTPEWGVSQGHLLVENANAAGATAILLHGRWHTVSAITGLFCATPSRVIFQTSHGFFQATHWHT
ncbi:MAG: hypothetical protein OWS74_00835 [Firmicutes bacterium]|nr:hypothetical protein [Bacillota bacterium]